MTVTDENICSFKNSLIAEFETLPPDEKDRAYASEDVYINIRESLLPACRTNSRHIHRILAKLIFTTSETYEAIENHIINQAVKTVPNLDSDILTILTTILMFNETELEFKTRKECYQAIATICNFAKNSSYKPKVIDYCASISCIIYRQTRSYTSFLSRCIRANKVHFLKQEFSEITWGTDNEPSIDNVINILRKTSYDEGATLSIGLTKDLNTTIYKKYDEGKYQLLNRAEKIIHDCVHDNLKSYDNIEEEIIAEISSVKEIYSLSEHLTHVKLTPVGLLIADTYRKQHENQDAEFT